MDKEEKRIAKALGAQEVPEVDEGNLLKYRKYLLEQPFQPTPRRPRFVSSHVSGPERLTSTFS